MTLIYFQPISNRGRLSLCTAQGGGVCWGGGRVLGPDVALATRVPTFSLELLKKLYKDVCAFFFLYSLTVFSSSMR